MRSLRTGAIAALATLTLGAGLLTDGNIGGLVQGSPGVSKAEAKVGHPLTPGSVAGVHRRIIRRSTIYFAVLPAHCAKVSINGTWLYHCSGRYYQPYGGRYVVVYVQ